MNADRGDCLRLFWTLKLMGRPVGFAASKGRTEASEIEITIDTTNEARWMHSRECVAKGHTRRALTVPMGIGDCPLDSVKRGLSETPGWYVSCLACMLLFFLIYPRLQIKDRDRARQVARGCRPHLGAKPPIYRRTALSMVRHFRSEDRFNQEV